MATEQTERMLRGIRTLRLTTEQLLNTRGTASCDSYYDICCKIGSIFIEHEVRLRRIEERLRSGKPLG